MLYFLYVCFFFNDTATTEIYTLSLHDALPIYSDSFRRAVIDGLRIRKGLEPLKEVTEYSTHRDEALNRWADLLRENLDLGFIKGLVS